MSGLGRRIFAAGEVLTASNVMGYLQDQAVMSFAGTAARGSAIATPWQGATSFLQDSGVIETYYNAYGTANPGGPGGAGTAGWFKNISGFNTYLQWTGSTTWTVPVLGNPWVKVTCIGGGGGGAGAAASNGSQGGTSTFNAGSAGTVTATGGFGGKRWGAQDFATTSTELNASANGGHPGITSTQMGGMGAGGQIRIDYLNLKGITSVTVTVGAGGAAGTGSVNGTNGGAGIVFVEFIS